VLLFNSGEAYQFRASPGIHTYSGPHTLGALPCPVLYVQQIPQMTDIELPKSVGPGNSMWRYLRHVGRGAGRSSQSAPLRPVTHPPIFSLLTYIRFWAFGISRKILRMASADERTCLLFGDNFFLGLLPSAFGSIQWPQSHQTAQCSTSGPRSEVLCDITEHRVLERIPGLWSRHMKQGLTKQTLSHQSIIRS